MDMDGHTLTPKLPVDNLDTPLKVRTVVGTAQFCFAVNKTITH